LASCQPWLADGQDGVEVNGRLDEWRGHQPAAEVDRLGGRAGTGRIGESAIADVQVGRALVTSKASIAQQQLRHAAEPTGCQHEIATRCRRDQMARTVDGASAEASECCDRSGTASRANQGHL
jgi:hypothetical protein